MKKFAAVFVLFAFFVIGIAAAEAGCGTCAKGDSAFECMAKCIKSWSWSKLGCEKSATATAPAAAPAISDEELQKQRESVGMGMRGKIQ